MITKERFTELMNAALKKRKISKKNRDAMISADWFLICEDNAEPDSIIEHEEQLTSDYLATQKQVRTVLSEHAEQALVVQWFRLQYKGVWIHSTPNGASLTGGAVAWQKLKDEGCVAGVADLFVPAWGLWIEMKDKKGGTWLDSQKIFKAEMEKIGHTYLLCNGFDDAKNKILEFLK